MLLSACCGVCARPRGSRAGNTLIGKAASWLGKVFALNPAGLNWPRAVMVLDVLLVPLVVFWAIGHQEYLLSAVFGLLFAVGLNLSHGYWMPTAAIVAMKASLDQTTLVAGQRLA